MLVNQSRLSASEKATLYALRALAKLSDVVDRMYAHQSSAMSAEDRAEVEQRLGDAFSAIDKALSEFEAELDSRELR